MTTLAHIIDAMMVSDSPADIGPLLAGMLIVRGGYLVAFAVTALIWLAAFASYYPAWRSFSIHHGRG